MDLFKRIQDLSAIYDDDGPSAMVPESRPMFNERMQFDGGGTPLQRLRQEIVESMKPYAPGDVTEDQLQLVVKDITLDMTAEEAQASALSNFRKLFGMADGGRAGYEDGGMLVQPNNDGSRPGYAKVKKSVGQPRQYNLEKIEEAILKANQGDKYISYEDLGKKLNLESPGRISGIVRREGITPLDSYKIKVEKAYIKLFSDFDRNATELTKPLHRIKEMIGGYKYRKNANPNRSRVEDISNALKSSKVLNWDEEVKPIINRLSSANFLKNINKDWTLGDVQNSLQTKSMLRKPKDDAQRLMDYAVRNQIMSKGDTEFSIYNKNNLNKRITDFSQVDSYYDLAFKDGSGKVYDMDYIKTKGRSDPLFQEYFKLQDDLSDMKNRTTWPDGSDIIDPKTGKKTTFGNYSGQMYKFGYGYKKPFSRFPYEIDHNDGVAKNPFKNLSILPQRVNVALGAATRLDKPEIASKIGKDYFRNLPIDDLLMQEKNLGNKILLFNEKGEHVGKNLKTSYMAAKDEIIRKSNIENDLLKLAGQIDPDCKQAIADGGRIGLKTIGSPDVCITKARNYMSEELTKGIGTQQNAKTSLIKRILAGSANFLKQNLSPKELFKMENLIGKPALYGAAAFETGLVADDVLRKGKPLNVSAAESLFGSVLNLDADAARAKNLLESNTQLSPAAKEYAQNILDYDKYRKLDLNFPSSLVAKSMPGSEKYFKMQEDLKKKIESTPDTGVFDYQSALDESEGAFKAKPKFLDAPDAPEVTPLTNKFAQPPGRRVGPMTAKQGVKIDLTPLTYQNFKPNYDFTKEQFEDYMKKEGALADDQVYQDAFYKREVEKPIEFEQLMKLPSFRGASEKFAGGGIAKIAGDRSGAMTRSMNPDSQGLSYLFNRVKKVQE